MGVQNQEMAFAASGLLRLINNEESRLNQINTVLIICLLGACGIYIGASNYLIYKRTLKSISLFQAGTKIIGAGNLEYSIEEINDDEIGELCCDFNDMTRKLGRSYNNLENEIAERKRVEEAMRESEARYLSLFENMLHGFAFCRMLFDDHGRPSDFVYLDVNRAFGRLTGLEDVTGKKVTEVIPGIGESNTELLEIYGRVAMTGQAEKFEIELKPLGMWFSISVYSPERGYFVAVFDNITERKQAESALCDSERLYRAIGESIDYGVWVCAPDGRCTYASESFLGMVGMTQEQCSNFGWGDILHPDDAENTISAWKECVRSEGVWDIEHRFLGTDGQWHAVLARGVPVRNDSGEVIFWAGINLDISRMKQAEEALRNSENKFSILFNKASLPVVLSRFPDHVFVDVNDAWAQLFGYTKEESIGKTSLELGINRDAERRTRMIAEVRRHEQVFNLEQTLFSKSGDALTVLTNVNVITIGGQEYALTSIQDITERKRAEDELRASEEKFSTMLQTVPIAIALATLPDGALYNVNPAWLDLTGIARKEDAIGKTSLELGLIGDAAQREIILNEFRQNGFARNVELAFCSRKGVQHTVLVNLDRVEIGGRAFILSTMEEITERKRAEEVLKQKQAELLEAQSLAKIGSWHWDADTDATTGTDELLRIYGFDPATKGMPDFQKQRGRCYPVPDWERINIAVQDTLKTGVGYELDVQAFRGGVPIWVTTRGEAVLNAGDRIVGLRGTVQDITERKRAEEELQKAKDNLEGRVRERTAELLTAMDTLSGEIAERQLVEEELRATNSTMRRLLRTIAHEFRTPLGLLTGSTDILDRYWDRLPPEKRLEQNEQIRNAAHQISNLVNSVISFQLSGTDRPANPPLLQDIGGICRSIATEVETVWGAGHEFVVSIAADCGSAFLDDILFRRILQNLLSNAFRYTSTNGTVSLLVRREKDMLLLVIADTGIGIPEEDQEMIFDAFYRSRNVEGLRGLGLGLSIVRESLSQIGGTITVNSRMGVGTTMRVEIPVADSV